MVIWYYGSVWKMDHNPGNHRALYFRIVKVSTVSVSIAFNGTWSDFETLFEQSKQRAPKNYKEFCVHPQCGRTILMIEILHEFL